MVNLTNIKETWASPFASEVSSAHCGLILLQLTATIELKFTKHLIGLAFTQLFNIYQKTQSFHLRLFTRTPQIAL